MLPPFMLAVLKDYSEIPRIFCERARSLSVCVTTCSCVHQSRWASSAFDWLAVNIYGSGVPNWTSSCWIANMQTDQHVCCVKNELLSSCRTFCVLVGVTGSVAALKLPLLVSQLLQLPGVSCPVLNPSILLRVILGSWGVWWANLSLHRAKDYTISFHFNSRVCFYYVHTKYNVVTPLQSHTFLWPSRHRLNLTIRWSYGCLH